ncbi:MAG: hypothetical protein ABIL78_05505 [candidate division WOR-3 bacterium]
MKVNRFLLVLIIFGCARVGYPPGKPETNPPNIEIEYPQKFNKFPIQINLKIKDDTKIKTLKILENEQKIFEFQIQLPETTISILIDTLKDFSDTTATYNFTIQAEDIYDNIANKKFTIYYKKEENPPSIQILDTNFTNLPYTIHLNLKDDTKLKNLTLFKDKSILNSFSLSSKDTTLLIQIDSLNTKLLRLRAEDIYLNSSEVIIRIY